MRWVAAAAIYSFSTVPVLASGDCRAEGLAVLQRGATYGPFRFETQYKSLATGLTRMAGVFVPPDKAYTNIDGFEQIGIGTRNWIRTPLHGEWQAINGGDQSSSIAAPNAEQIASVACLGEVTEDGHPHIAYAYEVYADKSAKRPAATWMVLADRATGLPVKIVRRTPTNTGDIMEAVQARSYEPGLKVEPPDRKGGWERRADAFRLTVSQADTACRKEALSALLRILMSGPFGVEFMSVRGQLLDRVVVVPPDAVHWYREGTEQIFVNGQAWLKLRGLEWRRSPDSSNALIEVMDAILPDATFIGDVRCLGEAKEDGRAYRTYEYEKTLTYPDARAKTIAEIRKVLVNGMTGLPFRFEIRDAKGTLQRTETWVFDSSLSIDAPKLSGGTAQ